MRGFVKMGNDYNTSILVDWNALLFILERRFQAAVRRYKDTAEGFRNNLTLYSESSSKEQARVFLLDCEEVLNLAVLSNAVRLFVGFKAVNYDLADVRKLRSSLFAYIDGQGGGSENA